MILTSFFRNSKDSFLTWLRRALMREFYYQNNPSSKVSRNILGSPSLIFISFIRGMEIKIPDIEVTLFYRAIQNKLEKANLGIIVSAYKMLWRFGIKVNFVKNLIFTFLWILASLEIGAGGSAKWMNRVSVSLLPAIINNKLTDIKVVYFSKQYLVVKISLKTILIS